MFCKNSCLEYFFSPSSKNEKGSYIFLYFGKWNFVALILRDSLYFLKRKLFLYFGKRKPEKIPYISGNGTFLYFRKRKPQKTSGGNLPSSKNEKKKTLCKSLLHFRKWSFLASTLKNFLIFQEVTCKSWKSKIIYIRFKYKRKRKKVSYTFPYKEAKFSKLKHLLIMIIRHFFSFYNIFFYTQRIFI